MAWSRRTSTFLLVLLVIQALHEHYAQRKLAGEALQLTAAFATAVFVAAHHAADIRLRALMAVADPKNASCDASFRAAGANLLASDGKTLCGDALWAVVEEPALGGTEAQKAVQDARAGPVLLRMGPLGSPVWIVPVAEIPPLALAIPVPLPDVSNVTIRLIEDGEQKLLRHSGFELYAQVLPRFPGLALAIEIQERADAVWPQLAIAVACIGLGLSLIRSCAVPEPDEPVPVSVQPTACDTLELWDQHCGNILIWLDEALAPRQISTSSQQILGLTSAAMEAYPLGLPVPAEDAPKLEALVIAARDGHDPRPLRLRAQRADHGLAWLELEAFADRFGGVLVAARDVSRLHIAEAQRDAARHQLATLALQDPLTGLANDRRLREALLQELRRAQRHSQPLAVLVITPHDFEAYEERYGHVQGEACLRRVAQAIAAVLQRPGDLAARMPRNEFAVLLPGTGALGGAIVAQRARRAVRTLNLSHVLAPNGIVSLKIGLAWAEQNDDSEKLLEKARSAMRPEPVDAYSSDPPFPVTRKRRAQVT